MVKLTSKFNKINTKSLHRHVDQKIDQNRMGHAVPKAGIDDGIHKATYIQ